MKRTVNNAEVAHLWANQSQFEATNGRRSFFFVGDTIYSYGSHFPIARHVDGIVLQTTQSFSPTTSQHQSQVQQAAHHLQSFFVNNVRAISKREHLENLECLHAEYENTLLKASRARINAPLLLVDAGRQLNTLNEYSAFFKLRRRYKAADVAQIKARADKQAKAAAAKTLKDRAEALARYTEKLELWREHALSSYQLPNIGKQPAAMRLLDAETVETSQGVKFPVADALRVLPFVKGCKDKGTAWKRNGANIPIGLFQLDEIDEAGNVRAGCHKVEFSEVLHLENLIVS
jgi:hypothetical protein